MKSSIRYIATSKRLHPITTQIYFPLLLSSSNNFFFSHMLSVVITLSYYYIIVIIIISGNNFVLFTVVVQVKLVVRMRTWFWPNLRVESVRPCIQGGVFFGGGVVLSYSYDI